MAKNQVVTIDDLSQVLMHLGVSSMCDSGVLIGIINNPKNDIERHFSRFISVVLEAKTTDCDVSDFIDELRPVVQKFLGGFDFESATEAEQLAYLNAKAAFTSLEDLMCGFDEEQQDN